MLFPNIAPLRTPRPVAASLPAPPPNCEPTSPPNAPPNKVPPNWFWFWAVTHPPRPSTNRSERTAANRAIIFIRISSQKSPYYVLIISYWYFLSIIFILTFYTQKSSTKTLFAQKTTLFLEPKEATMKEKNVWLFLMKNNRKESYLSFALKKRRIWQKRSLQNTAFPIWTLLLRPSTPTPFALFLKPRHGVHRLRHFILSAKNST